MFQIFDFSSLVAKYINICHRYISLNPKKNSVMILVLVFNILGGSKTFDHFVFCYLHAYAFCNFWGYFYHLFSTIINVGNMVFNTTCSSNCDQFDGQQKSHLLLFSLSLCKCIPVIHVGRVFDSLFAVKKALILRSELL